MTPYVGVSRKHFYGFVFICFEVDGRMKTLTLKPYGGIIYEYKYGSQSRKQRSLNLFRSFKRRSSGLYSKFSQIAFFENVRTENQNF